MPGITHKKSQKYLRAEMDGLLSSAKRTLLDGHLHECPSCQADLDQLNRLGTSIKESFHARWDSDESSSRNSTNFVPSLKQIHFKQRINKGFIFLGESVLILLFAVIVNYIFAQLRISPASIQPSPNSPTGLPTSVVATSRPLNGLIIFVSVINGNSEIYSIQADGYNVTNLSKNPGEDFSPSWSPDGKHIAFINKNNDDANIYLMEPDGTEKIPLTNASNSDISFAWSPDGQKIIFSEQKNGDPNSISLSIININGDIVSTLIDGQGVNAFMGWSPDTTRIIYEKIDPKSGVGNIIYMINLDGSGRQELATHSQGRDRIASWQDSQHFYMVASNVDLVQLFRVSTDGTPPIKIESGDSGIVTWFKSNNNLIYVTNSFQSWNWNRIDGTNTTFLSTWPNYAALCQKLTVNKILGSADNLSSPNGLVGLVNIQCDEGSTAFYIVSNDGSKITALFEPPLPLQFVGASWSPDGQFIVVDLGNDKTGVYDLYLIDIEKTLQDPTMHPLQLTKDSAWKYDPAWQPQLSTTSLPASTIVPADSKIITAMGFQFKISNVFLDDTVKILDPGTPEGNLQPDGSPMTNYKGGLCYSSSGATPCNPTGDSVLILDVTLITGDSQKFLEFEPRIIEGDVEKNSVEVINAEGYNEFYWIYSVNKSSHYSFLLKLSNNAIYDLQPLMIRTEPPVILNP